MSDSNEIDKPTKRRPLTLKSSASSIRQNLSHGRTRSVVVEKKKKRLLMPDGKGSPEQADTFPAEEEAIRIAAQKLGLSEQEYTRRQKALKQANEQEAERRKQLHKEEDLRKKQEDERIKTQKLLKEEEEKLKQAAEEKKRLEEDSEAPQKNRGDVKKKLPDQTQKSISKEAERPSKTSGHETPPILNPSIADLQKEEAHGTHARKKTLSDEAEEYHRSKKRTASPKSWGEPRRRQGKLTISNILNEDEERQRSLASMRRARQREKNSREEGGEERLIVREVIIPEVITVQELANRMATQTTKVIKYLIQQGTMAKLHDVLDGDTAQLIVEEFGHSVKRVSEADVEEGFIGQEDDTENLEPRAPIVTVMGHVDHGKTSLLDALRKSDVATGEAGGITQHIGAYQIKLEGSEPVTFIDTPGHAAFSSMRARGAKLTDIIILVVSADDGVMPQTVEAIHHAKEAKVPIIIAINKMDKEGADPQKVLNGLLQYEVVVEALGGEVQAIEVSAKKHMGLDKLIEAVLLQAELLELKANYNREADGVVIESKVTKGRGPLSSVIIKRGRLRRGDIVVAGGEWGKVRALVDERGQQKKTAHASEPVEILGLSGVPEPGELFAVVKTEARAREITEYRQRKRKEGPTMGHSSPTTLENIMSRLQEKQIQELPVLVKADTQGSAEAIMTSLGKLGNDEVKTRVVYAAAGGISESDILLAKGSKAPIIGFNVRANPQARQLAERENLEIRYYSIIYNLLDDIKLALEGMLTPEKREKFLGNAEVLEVFSVSKVGKVAGCRVIEGLVKRGEKVRLLRDDVIIHEGELSTLKHFKDEVPEVKSGQECGMSFARYQDLQKGDKIECFSVTEIARKL